MAGGLALLLGGGSVAGLTDGLLIERFSSGTDAAADLAFMALVERHGPMVLRACRRILQDEHEAQDASQATLLILSRRAGSIWDRDSIGP